MRGKCSPYLWTAGLFLLIAASDTLTALPLPDNETARPPTSLCRNENKAPGRLISSTSLSSRSASPSIAARAWVELVCSLTEN